MRRRKKEFGLYNILGMGKGNIARILAWETLVSSSASFASGSVFGIALSKFAEFALSRLANSDVNYRFYVSPKSIGIAAAFFSGIFVLIYLNSVLRIRLSDPISLFKSENSGEKPPKGNVFLGAAGVVILAAAYATALSVSDPIDAFMWFFAAVIMVIIATYLLFMSGSVIICRLLQKNRHYYYKLSHFVSVSSMTYRMKRNGAGLASICILVTMVLVMISASAGLYFGVEDSLRASCPRNFILRTDICYTGERASGLIGGLRDEIFRTADENGIDRKSIADYRLLALFCRGGEAITGSGSSEFPFSDSYCRFYFYSAEDYAALSGRNAGLSDGEILMYSSYGGDFGETLEFKSLGALSIKEQIGAFDQIGGSIYFTTIPTFSIVVSDLDQTAAALSELALSDGNASHKLQWYCAFDTSADQQTQVAASEKFSDIFRGRTESLLDDESGISSYTVQSAACSRDDFYGAFGGIFYLGIMLGLVFTTSAVLIIYYKQISEGYEDQSRFETMKKVGVTSRDIRKSINS
ncbi:MAG: FtsX-like permease family protein, partial [Eubacteriales bacterium]